jgi:hypothetical protein
MSDLVITLSRSLATALASALANGQSVSAPPAATGFLFEDEVAYEFEDSVQFEFEDA